MARSIRLLLVTLVGVAAVAHAQGCGSDDGGLSSTVEDDAGRPIDRGGPQANGEDGGAALGTLRLAHLASGLGTVDFCYQEVHAGSFEGPVLQGGGVDPDASTDAAAPVADGALDAEAEAEDAGADPDASPDASASGLAFGTMTKYFTVRATGTITVAIVRAGATTCSSPIAEGTVTLDPGKLSTVVLFGAPNVDDAGAEDAGGLPVVAFIDDRTTMQDHARVRLIHAATGQDRLRVHAGSTLLTDELEPQKASAASAEIPVDNLGFATVAPIASPASLHVAPTAGGSDGTPPPVWSSTPAVLDLRGDSLHTGFVLEGEGGGFAILWCADKSTTAELTSCRLLR